MRGEATGRGVTETERAPRPTAASSFANKAIPISFFVIFVEIHIIHFFFSLVPVALDHDLWGRVEQGMAAPHNYFQY